MTAFDHSAGDLDRGVPARVIAALVEFRAFRARVLGTEDLSVGQGRRFRAVQRRRTRAASRAGLLVIVAAVGFDGAALIGLHLEATRIATALDAVVMLVALTGWWLLPRTLRHQTEVVAWVVMTGLATSIIVTGLAVPTLTVQTVGYLLVLPGLIALVLPWRTVVHLRWLLAFSILSAVYLAAGTQRFSPDERGDVAVVLFVAVGASLAGHLLLHRVQVRSFAQLEHIKSLRRRASADMLELERVHLALERTARVDPLTGAGNRRRLDEDMRAIRGHIGRSGLTYGLIEVDLDHFKAINDTRGHMAGDDILRRAVDAMSGTLRATDAVYRFGGEEFIVILPVSSKDDVLTAAERLRAVVAGLNIEHPGNPGHDVVSISLGTTLIGAFNLGMTDDEWFGLTDRALYEAKAAGRNQVRFAGGTPPLDPT